MSDQRSEGDLPIEDRQWLSALREAMTEIDLVPPSVLDAARAAFSWRTIDAELAHLTYDSENAEAMAGARSQQAALRAMTFASSSFTIEIQVEPTMLLGQLIPVAGPGELTVTMQGGSSFGVPYDELGCFTIQPRPADAFRLQLPGQAAVVTDWISL